MMAFTLLFVSMVPPVPATTCPMPCAVQPLNVVEVTRMPDRHDCYVECGCRMDNHIDGMPHQLATHLIQTVISLHYGAAALARIAYPLLLPGFIPQHIPPPP